MSARVRGSAHSLLGAMNQKTQSLPVVGRIRPGIKVPTKAARAVPGVLDVYKEGLAAGATYDDIALAMKKIKDCPAYPLTPRNAPYFRVHQSDFAPGQAEKIMELYATKRPGDTVPHLYSFPIVFPSNDFDVVFREQFEAWKASSILFWSETNVETGKVNCMQLEQVTPDKNRRKRRWGGRQSEIVRECNPNDCKYFGEGECKHMGSLFFWIPGVTGAGVIELEFSSVYASLGIMEVLDLVLAAIGRIKGTIGGKPIFTISKKVDDVSVMDWQAGKATKQSQQIITLEASGLDMTQYLAEQELRQLPPPERQEAARLKAPSYIDSVAEDPASGDDPTDISGFVEERSAPAGEEPPPITEDDFPPDDDDDQPEPEPEPEPEPKAKPASKARVSTSGATTDTAADKIRSLLPALKWTKTDLDEFLVGNYKTVDILKDEKKAQEILATLIGFLPSSAKKDKELF